MTETPNEKEFLDDGFGNRWQKCGPDCCLEIVRPGKVQCSTEDCPFRTETPSYYA
jgi:hypothetical protein